MTDMGQTPKTRDDIINEMNWGIDVEMMHVYEFIDSNGLTEALAKHLQEQADEQREDDRILGSGGEG
jgi:hypothetical protein